MMTLAQPTLTHLKTTVLVAITALILVSCSSAPTRKGDVVQTGMASWYGQKFQGRKTASGERYNMREFTAAHRTLPFGTHLLVKSLTTGQTVRVRVNDRGPYSSGRILDLSYAAASQLGMLHRGEDKVEIRLD